MKSFLKPFLLFILLTSLTKAQENVFQPRPELKVYYGIPVNFGDNMLNKAHGPRTNFGFWTSPFSIYNFKIGFGFDYTKFKVTDVTLAGNIDRSDLYNFYGFVAYPFLITPKFELETKAGIGGNKLRQSTGSQRFGNMKGTSFLLGANLEYEFAYPFEIYAGTDYTYSRFNINANRKYEGFFNRASQLNIFIGLKANFGKRKKEKGDD